MAVLEQLGLNQTVFIQFIIFMIAFITLSQVVFKPYAKAFEAREQQTKGGEDLAQELLKDATELKNQYEQKARQVNSEIKTIFDSYRDKTTKEHDEIVSKARAESQKLVEEARLKVSAGVADATAKLKAEMPTVAAAITQKLLVK